MDGSAGGNGAGGIRRQLEENDWLEQKIVCAVLAIRKQ